MDEILYLDTDLLRDEELELILADRQAASESIWGVPACIFQMRHRDSGEKMGHVSFRVGERWNMKYAGQIGYVVGEAYRGRRYAERSVRLLLPFVRRNGLRELWITCNPDNVPSRRTLERLGAELVEIVDVPAEYPMEGAIRQKCRYRLRL